MHKVYVTNPIPKPGIDLLKKHGFRVDVNESGRALTPDGLKKVLGDYEGVITFLGDDLSANVLHYASGDLKVISNFAVGFDNIDVEAATKQGVVIANTPGVASESVAEHTFSLILALKKALVAQDQYVRRGSFSKWDPNLFLSQQLRGQTIGIIGLGRIGTFVGQMAYGGFRMKILYFDKRKSDDFEILAEARFAPIDEICATADIVTLHLPLNEETRHLIGEHELKKMKESAILINTARGAIIDEAALINAIKNGLVAGAGLDVFENEPEIPKFFMESDKVILTPHTASATFETRDEMSRVAAQNIVDVFNNEEPIGLVKI